MAKSSSVLSVLAPTAAESPRSEDDLIISLAMTDHYFDMKTLKQMGASIRKNGEPPNLDPETRKNLLEMVRGAGAILEEDGREF